MEKRTVSAAFCRKCGSPLIEGSLFCSICGEEVKVFPGEEGVRETKQEPVCGKCGSPLVEGALFCRRCGEKTARADENRYETVTAGEESPAAEDVRTGEAGEKNTGGTPPAEGTASPYYVDPKERQRSRKLLLIIIAGIAAAAAVIILLLASSVSPTVPAAADVQEPAASQKAPAGSEDNIVSHDIDDINGSPEFFGLEFGMSAEEASELVTAEHELSRPNGNDGYTILRVEEGDFSLYGMEAEYVSCMFDEDGLFSVAISFDPAVAGDYDIRTLFGQIYGEPDTAGLWIGDTTTVEIRYMENKGSSDSVWASYYLTENGGMTAGTEGIFEEESEEAEAAEFELPEIELPEASPDDIVISNEPETFGALEFLGKGIDPCGFLEPGKVIGSDIGIYTEGMTENVDYIEGTYGGYPAYFFSPGVSYMGIEGEVICSLYCEGDEVVMAGYDQLLYSPNIDFYFDFITGEYIKELGEPDGILLYDVDTGEEYASDIEGLKTDLFSKTGDNSSTLEWLRDDWLVMVEFEYFPEDDLYMMSSYMVCQ